MTWPLTPWYPATTKPVRPGLYLTALGGEQVIARWTGSVWCWLDGIARSNLQHWRGLVFDPASVTEYGDLPRGWWVPKP